MREQRTLTAAVHQDEDWYVAQCLEVDVASQGNTLDKRRVHIMRSPMTFGDYLLVACFRHARVGLAAVKRGRHTARNKSTEPPTLRCGRRSESIQPQNHRSERSRRLG